MNLTDTQLVLLSAAAQHEARLLLRPDHLSDKAVRSLATTLGRAELVEEIAVRAGQPHWRISDAGDFLALRITTQGLTALGLDPGEDDLNSEPIQPAKLQAPIPTRTGHKQAAMLALLGREEGVGIAELVAATGWLPHTTRAALTRLRQRGYGLHRAKESDGRAIYRLDNTSIDTPSLGDEG
jgi:hypothetical protein